MKQHITTKQLNELSEKGKERFYSHFMKKIFNLELSDIRVKEKGKKRRMPTDWSDANVQEDTFLLSIGQMIEFLGEDINNIWYLGGWSVGGSFQSELCDALWEAVEEILEK